MRCEIAGKLFIPVDKIIHLRSVIDEVFDDRVVLFEYGAQIEEKRYQCEIYCSFNGEDGVECNLLFELFLNRIQDLVGEGFHFDLETTVRWIQ